MPGSSRVDWSDRRLRGDLTNYLMRNSRKAGRALRDEARKAVSTRAVSDPGQAPGRRSGRLRKSIRSVVTRSRSRHTITIRVGSGLFYARFLELGTKVMRARPFLFREFQKIQRRMVELLVKG